MSRMMPVALRVLRPLVQPAAFVGVAFLSWLLVRSTWGMGAPEVCAPGAPEETPPPEVHRASVARADYRVAGMGEPGLELAFSSMDSRSAARPAETVRWATSALHEQGPGGVEPMATLLDGSRGPVPAHLMNCTSEGGSFRCGECATEGDCPAGQGCVINHEKRVFECVASECEEDAHCFPGFVCRVAAGGAPGPVTRRCLMAGIRVAGEPCSRTPATRDEACEEGLLCINHRCGPPCVPGRAQGCPEGHVCEESPSGAACLPDCRELGCPEDQQCAPLNGGVHQCLDLVVDECSDTKPCADGESCIVRGRGGRAGRFCAAACDSWRPGSCSGARVCGAGGPTGSACYAKCDPDDLSTCPAGWLCTTVTEDLQTWGCLPDFHGGMAVKPRATRRAPSSSAP